MSATTESPSYGHCSDCSVCLPQDDTAGEHCIRVCCSIVVSQVPCEVKGTDIPPAMRCTGQKLQDNGIFLIGQ